MKNESDSSLSPKSGSKRKPRAGAERADRSSKTAATRANRLYGKFAQDALMATAPTQVNEAKTNKFDANKSATNELETNECGVNKQSNRGFDDSSATEASACLPRKSSDTADGEDLITTDSTSRQDYSAANLFHLDSAPGSVAKTIDLPGPEEFAPGDLTENLEWEAQQFVFPSRANLQNADQSVVIQLDLPPDKQIRFAQGSQTLVYLTFSTRLVNENEDRAKTATEKGTNDNCQIAVGKSSPAVLAIADERAKLKAFRLIGKLPERRYILGTEIALAAVIASAGVARARSRTNNSGDDGEIASSNELSVEQKKRIDLDNSAVKTSGTEPKVSTTGYVILRTLDPAIGAFAINSEWIDQIVLPKRRASSPAIALPASVVPRAWLRRQTVMVSENDTLEIIAERYLFDAGLASLVADVNSHNIKQTYIDGKRIVELKLRQQLVMPLRREIADFYNRRSSERQEQLVTIVEVSQIDRELISTILGPIINANTSQIATKNITPPAAERDPGRYPKKQQQ